MKSMNNDCISLLDQRIETLREFGNKISNLEKRLKNKNAYLGDAFLNGSDAAILYEINKLGRELQKSLSFIERH